MRLALIRPFLVSLFTLGVSVSAVVADGLPLEVARLARTLEAIPGVTTASVGKTYLPDIAVGDLSLPGPFADLPIASLRRTDGSRPNELLISLNFTISRDEAGLKALEFLSWWVRDQSRGGETMQIRSMGLPPMAGDTVLLGQTLSFTIDWFYLSTTEDVADVLKELDAVSADLEDTLAIYAEAFQ